MEPKSTRVFVAVFILVLVAGIVTAPAPAQSTNPLVTGILDKMARAANNLRTLRATLRQQKINTQLGIQDVVEQGTLFYKPARDGKTLLRIDYVSPEVKTVLVNGDRFQLYQPKINQALEGTIKENARSSSVGFFSLRIDGKTISAYEISYVKDEMIDGVKTAELQLLPRDLAKAGFKSKKVWIDKATWLPVQFQIIEKNNDVTWFRLNDVQQNVQLADSAFKLQYKSGTQIVRG